MIVVIAVILTKVLVNNPKKKKKKYFNITPFVDHSKHSKRRKTDEHSDKSDRKDDYVEKSYDSRDHRRDSRDRHRDDRHYRSSDRHSSDRRSSDRPPYSARRDRPVPKGKTAARRFAKKFWRQKKKITHQPLLGITMNNALACLSVEKMNMNTDRGINEVKRRLKDLKNKNEIPLVLSILDVFLFQFNNFTQYC